MSIIDHDLMVDIISMTVRQEVDEVGDEDKVHFADAVAEDLDVHFDHAWTILEEIQESVVEALKPIFNKEY